MKNFILAMIVFVQFGLLYALNMSKYITHCSVVFISIAIVTNSIYQLRGKAFAMNSIMVGSLAVYLLQLNMVYQIGSKVVDNLVLFSLICTVLSAYAGLMVMSLKKISWSAKCLLSLLTYSLVDSLSMILLLAKYFSPQRLSYILSMEIFYKLLFTAIFVAIVHLVSRYLVSDRANNRSVNI